MMKTASKVFVILGISCCFAHAVSEVTEVSQHHPQNEHSEKEETDLDGGPSDVASVSKFIQEFHGSMYWTAERAEPVSGPARQHVESVAAAEVGNQTTPVVSSSDSDSDVNVTSVFNCNMERKPGSLTVELVNSTRLVSLLTSDNNITSRVQEADCVVLLFYARSCPFSCMAAPHFNALPRAFPPLKMAAVNALQYQSFNTQYGIVGVPTVLLFHNGRPAAKFNDSEYTLEMFTRFITRHTGILPEEKMFVTSADFGGPVPSVVARETDYWLGLSWLVIAIVGAMGVARSRMWHNLVEAVQNSWREAEIQHFHAD